MVIVTQAGLNEVGKLFFSAIDTATKETTTLIQEIDGLSEDSFSDMDFVRLPLNRMRGENCKTTPTTEEQGVCITNHYIGPNEVTAALIPVSDKDIFSEYVPLRKDELTKAAIPMKIEVDATSVIKSRDVTELFPVGSSIQGNFEAKLELDKTADFLVWFTVVGQVAMGLLLSGLTPSEEDASILKAVSATYYTYDWVNDTILSSEPIEAQGDEELEILLKPYTNSYSVTIRRTLQKEEPFIVGTAIWQARWYDGDRLLLSQAFSGTNGSLTQAKVSTYASVVIDVSYDYSNGLFQTSISKNMNYSPSITDDGESGLPQIGSVVATDSEGNILKVFQLDHAEPRAVPYVGYAGFYSANAGDSTGETESLINPLILQEALFTFTTEPMTQVVYSLAVGDYGLDEGRYTLVVNNTSSESIKLNNDYSFMFPSDTQIANDVTAMHSKHMHVSGKHNMYLPETYDYGTTVDRLGLLCLGDNDGLNINNNVTFKAIMTDKERRSTADVLNNSDKVMSYLLRYSIVALPNNMVTVQPYGLGTFPANNGVLQLLGYAFPETVFSSYGYRLIKVSDNPYKVIAIQIDEDALIDEILDMNNPSLPLPKIMGREIKPLDLHKALSGTFDVLSALIITASQTIGYNKYILLKSNDGNVYINLTQNLGSLVTFKSITFESDLESYTYTYNTPYTPPNGVYISIFVTFEYTQDNETLTASRNLNDYSYVASNVTIREYLSVSPIVIVFNDGKNLVKLNSREETHTVSALQVVGGTSDDVTDITPEADVQTDRIVLTDINFTQLSTNTSTMFRVLSRLDVATLEISNQIEYQGNPENLLQLNCPSSTEYPMTIDNSLNTIDLVVQQDGNVLYRDLIANIKTLLFTTAPSSAYLITLYNVTTELKVNDLSTFPSTLNTASDDNYAFVANPIIPAISQTTFDKLIDDYTGKQVLILQIHTNTDGSDTTTPSTLVATIPLYAKRPVLGEGVTFDPPLANNETIVELALATSSLYFESDGSPLTDNVETYEDTSNQECMWFTLNGDNAIEVKFSDYIIELNEDSPSAMRDVNEMYPMYQMVDFNGDSLSDFKVTRDGTVIDVLDTPSFSGSMYLSENQETLFFPYDRNRLFMMSYTNSWVELPLSDFLDGTANISFDVAVLPSTVSGPSTEYELYTGIGEDSTGLVTTFDNVIKVLDAIPTFGRNLFEVTKDHINLTNYSVNDYLYVTLIVKRNDIAFSDDSVYSQPYDANYQFYNAIKLV